MDEAFFGPIPTDPPRPSRITIFSGGDTGRDYNILFEAVNDLPVTVRLAASAPATAIPLNVELLPRLRLHEFRNEMARADIVVVPLIGEPEVAGVTVVAMARMLGKPVIATDLPVSHLHITSPGDDGLLVPKRDARALRAAIQSLLADPAKRAALGDAARLGAMRDLTPLGLVKRMLECDNNGFSETRIRIAASTPQGGIVERAIELWPSRQISEALLPVSKEFARKGATASVFLFTGEVISTRVTEMGGQLSSDGRLRPVIIARGVASSAVVRDLASHGVRQLYFTVDGSHGEVTTRVIKKVAELSGSRSGAGTHVGIHLTLVREVAKDVPSFIHEMAAAHIRELLLWESPSWATPFYPEETLRVLDAAWKQCAEAEINLRVVGFKSLRHLTTSTRGSPPLADQAIVNLLRQGIHLPAAASGLRVAGARNPGWYDFVGTGAGRSWLSVSRHPALPWWRAARISAAPRLGREVARLQELPSGHARCAGLPPALGHLVGLACRRPIGCP